LLPKVDEDGKVIKNEETGAIEYEGDVYLNNYFERRERQYKDNPDALEALKLLKTVHSQVIGTYGKGEKGFLNSSMKAISQTLIMSWLGKNYQWAIVEGTAGLSALGEGGILKGVKLYSSQDYLYIAFLFSQSNYLDTHLLHTQWHHFLHFLLLYRLHLLLASLSLPQYVHMPCYEQQYVLSCWRMCASILLHF
jgi:hypothetical protein